MTIARSGGPGGERWFILTNTLLRGDTNFSNPPRSFHEALQALWFVQIGFYLEANALGYSPGRFDQYMWPYYKKDLEEEKIAKQEAQELLDCLWIKLSEANAVFEEVKEKIESGAYDDGPIGNEPIDTADSKEDGYEDDWGPVRGKTTYLAHEAMRNQQEMAGSTAAMGLGLGGLLAGKPVDNLFQPMPPISGAFLSGVSGGPASYWGGLLGQQLYPNVYNQHHAQMQQMQSQQLQELLRINREENKKKKEKG